MLLEWHFPKPALEPNGFKVRQVAAQVAKVKSPDKFFCEWVKRSAPPGVPPKPPKPCGLTIRFCRRSLASFGSEFCTATKSLSSHSPGVESLDLLGLLRQGRLQIQIGPVVAILVDLNGRIIDLEARRREMLSFAGNYN